MYKSVDADGHVVYSDRPDESSSQSSRVHIEDRREPPPVFHFCWTNCFTLVLRQGIYTRADGTDETWTIERFTASEFVLHRHDAPVSWNRFSNDVVYRGQITNDRLVNVTVSGAPVRDIQMAWGDALDTLPGSNAERDQRLAQLQQASASESAVGTPAIAGDMLETSDTDMRANDAPPPLPDEEPPASPADQYLWTPGYWAWHAGGYQWVAGAWVAPPRVGVLWTPGYWAYTGTIYVFHRGYWGPHVGFYGGINYGHGYPGVGGGSAHRVSFNGGPGGIVASPTAAERAVAAEPHVPPAATPRHDLQQAAATEPTLVHINGNHLVPDNRLAAAVNQKPQVASAPPVMPLHTPVHTAVEPPHPTAASPLNESPRRAQPAAASAPAPKSSRTIPVKESSPPKP